MRFLNILFYFSGKKLVHELKNILERIMNIAKIMENFQRKLLLLACKKASDITNVLKNTQQNNQWSVSNYNFKINTYIYRDNRGEFPTKAAAAGMQESKRYHQCVEEHPAE